LILLTIPVTTVLSTPTALRRIKKITSSGSAIKTRKAIYLRRAFSGRTAKKAATITATGSA
jgi:hypothetical protein